MVDTPIQHCMGVSYSAKGVVNRGAGSLVEKGGPESVANYWGITLLKSLDLPVDLRPILTYGHEGWVMT